jgi:hypothetical protein
MTRAETQRLKRPIWPMEKETAALPGEGGREGGREAGREGRGEG